MWASTHIMGVKVKTIVSDNRSRDAIMDRNRGICLLIEKGLDTWKPLLVFSVQWLACDFAGGGAMLLVFHRYYSRTPLPNLTQSIQGHGKADWFLCLG